MASTAMSLLAVFLSSAPTAGASVDPTPETPCPDSAYLDKITISWRDTTSEGFTRITVWHTQEARGALIGTGGQLVSEFLDCMRLLASHGETIYAKSYWGRSVTFYPSSTNRDHWQTFIDQLQCHDAPPVNMMGDTVHTAWGLEGHRPPTRNRVIWGLTSCNWSTVALVENYVSTAWRATVLPVLPISPMCATVRRVGFLSWIPC